MNDRLASLYVSIAADAPNWRTDMRAIADEARRTSTDVQRSFEGIKGPNLDQFARWDRMLDTVTGSINRAVRAGRDIPASATKTLGSLHEMFVDMRDAPGAYARADYTSQLRQFVFANSFQEQSPFLADQSASVRALALSGSRAAANRSASDRDTESFFGRISDLKRADADQAIQGFVSAIRDAERAATQGARDTESFFTRIANARRELESEVGLRSSAAGVRRIVDTMQNTQAGGRSLYDTMGPSMVSDWRTPHYGATSSWFNGQTSDWMNPYYGSTSDRLQPFYGQTSDWWRGQTQDWRNPYYGRSSQLGQGPLGIYGGRIGGQLGQDDRLTSFRADTDAFWSRRPGEFRGHPDQANERWLRNANFAGQQLAFGIDDAIQTYQYGGMSAAIRAASNNVTAVAGTAFSPGIAVPAVIGLSLAAAFASQSARNMERDSPWTTQFGGLTKIDTDPNNPMRNASWLSLGMTGAARTMDQIFGGGETIYRDAHREHLRLETRNYDMNRTGFNELWQGRNAIRGLTSYDDGLSTYRAHSRSIGDTQRMLDATRAERFQAEDSAQPDTQKIRKLEEQERSYERQLRLQKQLTAEAREALPHLQRQADAIRGAGISFQQDMRRAGFNLEDNKFSLPGEKFANADEYLATIQKNMAAQRARIRGLNLPKDQEDDMLRAIDQQEAEQMGQRDVIARGFEQRNRNFIRDYRSFADRSIGVDAIANKYDTFRERTDDAGLDPLTRTSALRNLARLEREERADYLYAQRNQWKVRDARLGFTQLDSNMEEYGQRLEEIERQAGLSPEERTRQMRAARKAFDEANKAANTPTGTRRFSTSGYEINSREDVELEAFMRRQQYTKNSTNDPNQNLAAVINDGNRMLAQIEQNTRDFRVVQRTA